ncbi:GGDEF domain-containing protein [Nitrincola sp. MINF-07-Sa-05]|uniref:GGDEF domain-containing protein n=1 Tax=Nitrincola salilacus TaxID=3400273 RepID=UPI0039181814
MNLLKSRHTQLPDVMNRLLMRLSLVCIVLLTPLVINNFVQGRILLGGVSLVTVVIFCFTSYSIYRYKKYHTALVLLLVPAILLFLFLSITRQGTIGVLWSFPAIVSFYLMLPERQAWCANVLLLAIVLSLSWLVFDHSLALRITVTLCLISLFAAIFINVISAQSEKLHRLAVTDALTDALNRSLLEEVMSLAVSQKERSGMPMTLIVFDLDYFKSINDELGHDAGDQVLKQVSSLLRKRCRSVDRLFRLGGEEFLLYLHDTNLEGGKCVAEELRQMLEASDLLPGRQITMSAGVAELHSGESWSDWLKRGDSKLYDAKQKGRNIVVA